VGRPTSKMAACHRRWLTSVRPARQVSVSQSQLLEPSGSLPRARDSLGTLHPEFGNVGKNWGDQVTRSDVPPKFNRPPVVNRLGDRAVYPVSSGECYQSRGREGNPATVEWAVTFAPEGHDEGPVITVQYRQMDPAIAEAGLMPRPGAPRPSSIPVEIGLEPPCSLRQTCPPSVVHTYPPQRVDVPLRGALASHPVILGDQIVGQWVRAPSVASGVPSSSSVPAAKQEGFIAESRERAPP